MIRETLNLYLDGFLSLSHDKKASRWLLIEEALSATSLTELIREWIWIQELDQAAAIKLKIWFQLSYKELSVLFGISVREVSQLLRNQRVLLLPGYRPAHASQDSQGLSDISCFMVEQHLSPWVDGELTESKTLEAIHRHLFSCGECRGRLQHFRDLQSLILQSRGRETEITELEWERALKHLKRETTKHWIRAISFTVMTLLVSAFLAWAIFSKPEKMPNVYDIHP